MTLKAQELHQHRKNMYDSIADYHRQFLDTSTGLIKKNYVEQRSCPVCDSNQPLYLFNKNGGTFVKCNHCTMVYLNPVFKDDELALYYQNNTGMQAAAHESENDFYRTIYSKGLDLIEAQTSIGKILDIGCSGGFFLDLAKARGWQTYGLELNKTEVAIAKKKGHQIQESTLEDWDVPGCFEAICLWDVFEHIKDGAAMLTCLAKMLKPGGVIFLQIPNAASLAARILHEKCNMFDGIEHVNLYNPKTLQQLAQQQGFIIPLLHTVIDELAVTKNHLNYDAPYSGQFLNTTDLDFLTPALIHDNHLGYKIQAILTKK